jgi:sugar/nucleoside kinase (ribokinase family)
MDGYVAFPSEPPVASGRLVFAGEAIVDVAMRVPAFPVPGRDVLGVSSQITVGGGFNVMAAAARQGMPVLYAGGHGTGPWGDLVRKALTAEGIAILTDPDPDRDTGFAVGLTLASAGEPSGTGGGVDDSAAEGRERAYATQLGAESAHHTSAWDLGPDGAVGPDDVVYISGYGLLAPDSGAAVAAWAAALPPGPLLFLDPGPLAGQIPAARLDPVLSRCDWLSCNAAEAMALSGAGDLADAARALLSRTALASRAGGGVIVRTGPGGCVLARHAEAGTPSLVTSIPAPAVDALDTTGAGDAHAGVFLASLTGGLSPADSARRANAAAALAATRRGPATCPARAELDTWISRF